MEKFLEVYAWISFGGASPNEEIKFGDQVSRKRKREVSCDETFASKRKPWNTLQHEITNLKNDEVLKNLETQMNTKKSKRVRHVGKEKNISAQKKNTRSISKSEEDCTCRFCYEDHILKMRTKSQSK